MNEAPPDFINLPLQELSATQWEQLCDHCGKCCLLKLEDMDDHKVYLTDIVCRKYDMQKSACSCYADRTCEVEDCVRVTLAEKDTFRELPSTCAYRLRFENRPLPEWHPLLTGTRNSVVAAGISIKDRVYPEDFIHPDEFAEHIIEEIV